MFLEKGVDPCGSIVVRPSMEELCPYLVSE